MASTFENPDLSPNNGQQTAYKMIAAGESRVFVPNGRHILSSDMHPGRLFSRSHLQKCKEDGDFDYFETHSKFSLRKSANLSSSKVKRKEFWRRRVDATGVTDELYVFGDTVIWSREGLHGKGISSLQTGTIVRSLTVDTPVQDALWTKFKEQSEAIDGGTTEPVSYEEYLVVLESTILSAYAAKGKTHTTFLPFPVSRVWPLKDGLLVERDAGKSGAAANVLSTMFTLSHPLDEFKPILSRSTVGGASTPRMNYVTDTNIEVVFTSRDPSIVVFYDKRTSLHSIWLVEDFTNDPESFNFQGMVGVVSGVSSPMTQSSKSKSSIDPARSSKNSSTSTNSQGLFHQSPLSRTLHSSTMSRLTGLSSNTHSPQVSGSLGSPFRTMNSRLNSPTQSRPQSPSISHMASLTRCQTPSPSRTHVRLGNASFNSFDASVNFTPSKMLFRPWTPRTARGANASTVGESFYEQVEPLPPEVFIDLIWTENFVRKKSTSNRRATKVDITVDFARQKYICFLISASQNLMMVKFEDCNESKQLIFGSVTNVPAIDFGVVRPKLLVILDPSQSLILYSGTTKIGKIYVGGDFGQVQWSPSFTGSLVTNQILSAIPSRLTMALRLGNQERQIPSTPKCPPSSSNRPSVSPTQFVVSNVSPVPTELSGISLKTLTQDSPIVGVFNKVPNNSATKSDSAAPLFTAIRETHGSNLVIDLTNGSSICVNLPDIASHAAVRLCLDALLSVLPKDVSLSALSKWYLHRNSPGGYAICGTSEWVLFCKWLMSSLGYDLKELRVFGSERDEENVSQEHSFSKKLKPADSGEGADWEALLSSSTAFNNDFRSREANLLRMPKLEETAKDQNSFSSERSVNSNQFLFPFIPSIFYGFYLVYEELKLGAKSPDDFNCLQLATHLLHILAADVGFVEYLAEFERDKPELVSTGRPLVSRPIGPVDFPKLNFPSFIPHQPIDVYQWLDTALTNPHNLTPLNFIPKVTVLTRRIVSTYLRLVTQLHPDLKLDSLLRPLKSTRKLASLPTNLSADSEQRVFESIILHFSRFGLNREDVMSLPFGVSLLPLDALYHCRLKPAADWPEHAFLLIGREDLLELKRRQRSNNWNSSTNSFNLTKIKNTIMTKDDEQDGMEIVDSQLLRMLYKEDLRVQEARKLLQSSKPVVINIAQRAEVSDHEFVEEQERCLSAFCVRTMALPIGRGIFTLHTTTPIITETLPVPNLNLTGRALPRNTTVELTHIEVPANMSAWPAFHNGVAAGLKLVAQQSASAIASAWITFNCPKSNNLTNEHAGFLMALGLNGHLSRLTTLNIHDYLCREHDFTGVGLLLGIASAHMGTMDVATTRVLSIHVGALLPPTSTELDVSHPVQVAAVMSIGLVFAQTAHRHMAEILLGEIGRPPGPEMENCVDRESYSLAAGLALGFVMLGKGNNERHGLSDLSLSDQLYHLMVGGTRRPPTGPTRERYRSPSYQIREGNSVNTDVTSPGATLALGMMFFKTGNQAVAQWMEAPDTQFLLEFVRPDFLLLRTVARGLILWEEVAPTLAWLESNIPEIVLSNTWSGEEDSCFSINIDPDVDIETMTQARLNFEAGACMIIGLRFAGTANEAAFKLLHGVACKLIRLQHNPSHPASTYAGKNTVESCLVTVVVSLAMVMAGSGNLEVIRICRLLHARVGSAYASYVTYGSHMAVHMALGLLFMGGGRYTLGNSGTAVAAMLCAFFPKWPVHSNDNRYHLQAFRHLYVLAAERRIFLPVDVDSRDGCYVPIELEFKEDPSYLGPTKFQFMAPCMLPDLNLLRKISVKEPRYWPVEFERGKNWDALTGILSRSGEVFVKRRAGHLSYEQDPKGYRSQLMQSFSNDGRNVQRLNLDSLKNLRHLSSDACVQAFGRFFCCARLGGELKGGGASRDAEGTDAHHVQTMSSLLQECVADEKPETMAAQLQMIRAGNLVHRLDSPGSDFDAPSLLLTLTLCQLKLVKTYAALLDARRDTLLSDSETFVSSKFIRGSLNLICRKMEDIMKKTEGSKDRPISRDSILAQDEEKSIFLRKASEILIDLRSINENDCSNGERVEEDDDESPLFLKAYCDNKNSLTKFVS